jgi:curved DNA-binding protein CbpA
MAPVPVTEDYYLILKVEQFSSLDVIKKSYKQLALKLHPDKNAGKDTTEDFQLVCWSHESRLGRQLLT